MKIRPWLCALLIWSFLGGLTACSDSSDEVDALRTQVEELQERLDAASATTRAPSTTTTEAESTKEERDRVEEEQDWIEEQLATFIQGHDLVTTRSQARCILQRFVDARGTSSAEDLFNRVNTELDSVGRLSASDADAFLEPLVACINLVAIMARDLQIADPDLDARCMVKGLEESQVADWYRTVYVEGEEAMQAAMNDWMSSRFTVCMATTTQAPTTTSGFKGSWKTSVEQDPMDDSWTTVLTLKAVETFTITPPFPTKTNPVETFRPVLHLHCHQGHWMQVYVYSGGARFHWPRFTTSPGWDEDEPLKAALRYRVGDKPAVSADVHLAENEATAWFENDVEIIRDLRGASRMHVEVDMSRNLVLAEQVLMTFDTRGLEYHLPLLTKHCPGQL